MSLRTAFYRSARPLSSVSRPALSCTMPLRAKIIQRSAATTSGPGSTFNDDLLAELAREQPGDEADDVIFGATHGVRTIELNRPKKLNSLNGSMARKILPRLREWEKSQLANVIVIKGEGRAFCAGGDVAALATQNKTKEGQEKSREYFALEYKLDHMIATCTKPYVAFIDGITMGGGVGLSIHAPFRIATENTVFAMPETTIGFFPDVGASFFLPKMDGQMGMYLALTSEQLKGVDVFYHGVATHYVHSTSLPKLQARLAELQFPDTMKIEERNAVITSTIEEFTSTLPSSRPALSAKIRNTIDEVFAADDINDILRSLKRLAEGSDAEVAEWAKKTKETIEIRSPTSVLVTLRMLRASARWNIAEAFQREYAIAAEFMAHGDFVEGIEAKLIRRSKDRPNWSPNTLAEASAPKAIAAINAFFPDSLPNRLPLLRSGANSQFADYPHAPLSLPREKDILESLNEESVGGDPKKCVEFWQFECNDRIGVKEKVEDVLERHALREKK